MLEKKSSVVFISKGNWPHSFALFDTRVTGGAEFLLT